MAAEVTGICLGAPLSDSANAENRYNGTYTFNVTLNSEGRTWGPRKVIVESSRSSMAPDYGVPEVWDTLNIRDDVDSDIYCLGKQADWVEENEKGEQLWSVSCTFGPLSQAGLLSDDLEADPTNRLARWRLEFEDYSELVHIEPEKHPDRGARRYINNAALDPFIPSPTVQRQRAVWVFEIAVGTAAAAHAFWDTYGGRINISNWTSPGGAHLGLSTVPRLSALLRRIRVGKRVEEQGFSYYPIELRFSMKGDDEEVSEWLYSYLNQGTRYLPTAMSTDKIEAVDANGLPSSGLVNLAFDGTKLADDEEAIYWPEGGAGKERYMHYKTADFNNIAFPA